MNTTAASSRARRDSVLEPPRRAQALRLGTLGSPTSDPRLTLTPKPTKSPISLLHTHGRTVPRRVRAVMSWITEVMGPYVEGQLRGAG